MGIGVFSYEIPGSNDVFQLRTAMKICQWGRLSHPSSFFPLLLWPKLAPLSHWGCRELSAPLFLLIAQICIINPCRPHGLSIGDGVYTMSWTIGGGKGLRGCGWVWVHIVCERERKRQNNIRNTRNKTRNMLDKPWGPTRQNTRNTLEKTWGTHKRKHDDILDKTSGTHGEKHQEHTGQTWAHTRQKIRNTWGKTSGTHETEHQEHKRLPEIHRPNIRNTRNVKKTSGTHETKKQITQH